MTLLACHRHKRDIVAAEQVLQQVLDDAEIEWHDTDAPVNLSDTCAAGTCPHFETPAPLSIFH